MATARKEIVDLDVTRFYHCISRCVRGAQLCGGGREYRKHWLENRLQFLASHFSISVGGFAIMDSHMHVLLRIDPQDVRRWSAAEVAKRWLFLCPGRLDLSNQKEVQQWLDEKTAEPEEIAKYRKRLSDMGWFMKLLKEPLARMANKEDGVGGAFWDARYKSIGVLEEEDLLATCAYIDLNPVAAGLAMRPETSQYTSIRQRVAHFGNQNKLWHLKSALSGSVSASHQIGNGEQDHWLIPFEDRRPHTNCQPSSPREGMLEKFTLGNYLLLIDYTGRLFREGKARISERIKPIFERLETSLETWGNRVKAMLSAGKLRGHRISSSEFRNETSPQ